MLSFHAFFFSVHDCGVPETLPNGTVEFGETTFGSISIYSCDVGFNLTNGGNDYRICTLDGWTPEVPSCECESLICSSCFFHYNTIQLA